MVEQRAAQAADGLCRFGALRRLRLVLGMLALLALLLPSLVSAQTSPPSALCPSLNMSVAHGGSQTINVDSCHTGFGIGMVGTPPTHGSASTTPFPSTITYTHVGGANVATSDFFSVEDEDGSWMSVSVAIAAPTSAITIAPSTLPAMTAGTAYSQQLSASGGIAPYTYSISGGALPAGLTMSSAGLISGTPTQRGNANFTVDVIDAVSDTSSRGYSVSVAGGTLSISPNPPPNGVIGVAYSRSFTASGGVGPYTLAWEANPANPLPPGLTLSGTTLSGTPTTIGTYTFGIRVTDSSTGAGSWFQVVTVTMAVTAAPIVTVNPTTLPAATVGAAYSQTLSGGGGSAPYTFSVAAGALPAGLALASSTGVISGTPTVGGSFNFTVAATDANAFSGSRAYAFTVAAPTVSVTPPTLPAATVGASYSQAITASGGTAPYTYAVTAGALPAGLTLASNGSLAGTATAGGSFNFTVTATDSSTGSGPYAGSRAYAFTVAAPTVTLAPATLSSASVGSAYSETITASGGTAPYSFAVTAGALPTGLSLASDGSLSGTATSGGSFNFTISATDSSTGSGPYAGSRAYAFNVAAPTVTLAPATLPSASVGSTYGETITASGGIAPYSFAITAGALPAGLTLASDGSLSGTATSGGSFNFTITATDSSAGSGPYAGSRAYTFTVAAPTMTVGPAALPSAAVGTAYNQAITAGGGTAPYAYALSSGALPAGLTLGSGGNLSGIPTASGTFYFTITATDSSTGAGPFDGTRAYSLTVAAPTVALTPATLPSAATGTAYNQAITASGGTAPYAYAVTAGSLPAGLTLAGDGTLSGTATASGSFNFTITATDSSTGTGPFNGSRAYAFTVAAPTVTVTPTALPSAATGTAYTQAITASGGTGPYSYALTAGSLPAGLTLASDGILSGTATASGTFNFTIVATDSSTGTGPFNGSRAYTLTVAAATVTVGPGVLPSATVGTAYSQPITASGGTAPYAYAVAAGSLPAGLTLAGDGTLSGTATASGTFNFMIAATDSSTGAGPFNGTRGYSLTVAAPTVALTPATLPSAATGTAYNQAITASGGTAPYAYAVTAGSLPAGLTLAGDGTLSGTATASGTFNFTIAATDSSTGTGPFNGSQAYALTVAAPTVTVTPTTLPSAATGAAYNQVVTANGGIAPYAFAITAGALPAGMTLASNGTLSGTATAGGSFNFTVTATDSSTGSGPYAGSQAYAFTVAAPTVTVAPATLPPATAGTAYSESMTASGGIAPYAFAITAGALPAGLTLASNGSLSGTATASGTFNFSVTATDSSTGSGPYAGSQTYVLTVAAPTVTVVPATLPSATAGTAYSQTIAASGGTAPYSFTVSGALPAGLALSASGELGGTPVAPGQFGFNVIATDSLGFTGNETYTLRVVEAAPVVVGDNAETGTGQAVTVAVTENDQGDISSVEVAAAPGRGTAVVSGLAIIYTPATGFFGTDSFRYRAIGPGGTSGDATVTITVKAGAVPQGSSQSISTLAGQTVTLNAALNASGGPFTGMTVVNAPATGAFTIAGTDLQYTPPANAAGPVSIGYTLENAFGSSALITSTITVHPLPVPVSTEVSTITGVPVHIELTAGAVGGPFTGAEVVSISPASSGTATIASAGSGASATFRMTFTPAPEFAGTAIVRFNVSNAFATSATASVTVTVAPRPDPSRDAEVLGMINAQADATRRFATAQIENFQQRLRAMHDGGANAARFSNQLTFVADRSCNETAYLGTGRSCASEQPADEQAGISEQAPAATETTAFAIWTGGALGSGDRDRLNGSSSLSFETSGVSAGADYRVNKAFAFGAGLGYGRDRTEVGQNGSRSDADNRTAALYGSWHPGDTFFFDGLLGYQWMSFDSQRHVTANGGLVQGERDGTQWFASISAGLDHHRGLLSISPYARLDHSRARLDAYAEHGDPVYALRYGRQDVDATTGNLGLDAGYRKPLDWGTFAPQLRIEYQHDFQGDGTATMHYADLLSGPVFQADLNGFDRNRFMMGFGAAFYLQRDLALRLEYRRLFGRDDERSLLFNLEKKY